MASWSDIAGAIARTAPLLGNLLPGVGTIAGVGVGAVASVVASALGVPADPDSIQSALQSDPAALAKVRQAELDNQSRLSEIAMQRDQNVLAAESAQYAIEVDDRKSARQRDVDTHDPFPNYLAVAVTVGFFGALLLMCAWPIPDVNKAVVYIMVGTLGTAWAAVMSYTYGSTRHSAAQTAKITEFAVSPGTVSVPPAVLRPPVSLIHPENGPYEGH
jgi:hypothetical protein